MIESATSLVVQHVLDTALSTEHLVESIGELDTAAAWRLDTSINAHVVVTPVRVNTRSVGRMSLHVIGNMVRVVTLISVITLIDIVGQLGLVEVNLSVLTVPADHVT